MGCSFLDVAQRDPGIQRGGDECVSERVRDHGLGDRGASGGLAGDPPGAVPVQPPPAGGQEDRPAGALADGPGRSPGQYAAPAGW